MKKKTTKKKIYSDDNKKRFDINGININEIIISKRLFPEIRNLNEYVIGYKHKHNIKPLYIKLPEYVCSGSAFKENTYLLKLTMLIFLKNIIKYGQKLRN